MKIKFNDLYLSNKKFKKKMIQSFIKNLKESNFIGGSEVSEFENNFKKLNQSKYCVSCANGSDALLIALKALKIKPGDEVITTAFSWIATSAAITMAGGKVVFCDVKKNQYNIDPESIEKKISIRTVGIIPVHLYGYPADMININRIAKKNKLWIIEDCAQSHMATIKKTKVGNFGNFGIFSFFPAKNIGALGDAGCLVTNNKNLAKKARLIANHGGKGQHILEGVNSRLDSIQASFLNIKLKHLVNDTEKRIKNADIYFKNLKFLKNVRLVELKKNYKNVYHQFVIRSKERNMLKLYLTKKGVETQIHYKQILPLMKAYRHLNLRAKNFPNAYNISKEILCLPISPEKKIKEIKYISKLILNFFQNPVRV